MVTFFSVSIVEQFTQVSPMHMGMGFDLGERRQWDSLISQTTREVAAIRAGPPRLSCKKFYWLHGGVW